MRLLAILLVAAACTECPAARYFASESWRQSVDFTFPERRQVAWEMDVELDVELIPLGIDVEVARVHVASFHSLDGPEPLRIVAQGDVAMLPLSSPSVRQAWVPLSVVELSGRSLLPVTADGWIGMPFALLDFVREDGVLTDVKVRVTFGVETDRWHIFPLVNTRYRDFERVPEPGEVLLPGDADRDGEVEFADFLRLSQRYGTRGTWGHGDFDGDFQVGFSDFLLLSQNYQPAAEVVPEPDYGVVVILLILAASRLSQFSGRSDGT